jgi:tRNA 2-thiouridine synthesizing protein A
MDEDVITLDCQGLLCPLPVLKARKRLMKMAAGQILEVAATDPMAAVDLPHFCIEGGHAYLGARAVGAVTRYRIRRGPDRLRAKTSQAPTQPSQAGM